MEILGGVEGVCEGLNLKGNFSFISSLCRDLLNPSRQEEVSVKFTRS